MSEIRQLDPIDFHSIFFLWKSMGSNCQITFFKISFFVFSKEIHRDLKQLEGE